MEASSSQTQTTETTRMRIWKLGVTVENQATQAVAATAGRSCHLAERMPSNCCSAA